MKIITTKPEARKLLGLAFTRDVDALVDQLILIPYGYDSNGRMLFDAEGIRRAAAYLAGKRDEAPSE